MESKFNIVDFIENNPMTKLSNTYQNKLLTYIKEEFTDYEQQIFVASFYGFLKYDSQNDFVVDLDNIWQWLGFSQKARAKELLERHFLNNKDYILLSQSGKQPFQTKGGHNKETFLLNIATFKKLCLKTGTKKADEIHDYFIKLEKVLQKVIQEESNELKSQLQQQYEIKLQLEQKVIHNESEKELIREKTILEQFPNNTQCVYYGIIDNVGLNNEKLIKFGNSNNLKNRVTKHKDTYLNFRLVNAFKVDNKLQIENAIKENKFFQKRLRCLTLKNKKYVELLSIEDISFSDLDRTIKQIISSIEYSPENYIKILEENTLLKKKIDEMNENNNTHAFILLNNEHKRLQNEYKKLVKLLKRPDIQKQYLFDNNEGQNFSNDNIQQEINTEKVEGFHYVNIDSLDNSKKYHKLMGSRDDVWNGIAYKTSGGLIKSDLIISKTGKIVSRKKSIQESLDNKFFKYGVNKTII